MGTTHGTCKPATVCAPMKGNGLAKRLGPAKREDSIDPRRAAFTQTEHVLLSLARVVEQRDKHTAGHCERLAMTSVALGMAMKLERSSLLALYLGGFLHDVGKVGIPDSILFKPGSLDDESYIDIVAFVLSFNGHPPGKDRLLPDPDALEQIVITAAP